MKCLKDAYGDYIWINENHIVYIEKQASERHFCMHFTNGETRYFTQQELKKLNKEEDE